MILEVLESIVRHFRVRGRGVAALESGRGFGHVNGWCGREAREWKGVDRHLEQFRARGDSRT